MHPQEFESIYNIKKCLEEFATACLISDDFIDGAVYDEKDLLNTSVIFQHVFGNMLIAKAIKEGGGEEAIKDKVVGWANAFRELVLIHSGIDTRLLVDKKRKMKAYIMRGVPGSGKSTRAKEIYESLDKAVYVSRDVIRSINPNLREALVSEIHESMIADAAEGGLDLVIDNTHCNTKTLKELADKLLGLGYTYTIVDVFQELIDQFGVGNAFREVFVRNKKRETEKIVPESVIHEMFLQGYAIGLNVVVFDIDGTLADIDHRLHHIKKETKDRKSFYTNMENDKVMLWVKEILEAMIDRGYQIVLLTGRSNEYCEETLSRLRSNGILFSHLLMRKSWNKDQDTEVKRGIYNRALKRQNVLFAVEDRTRVIEMWKDLGVPVLAINGGSNH